MAIIYDVTECNTYSSNSTYVVTNYIHVVTGEVSSTNRDSSYFVPYQYRDIARDFVPVEREVEVCRPTTYRPRHYSFRFSMASKLHWLRLDIRDVPKDQPKPKTAPRGLQRSLAAWPSLLRGFSRT